VWGSDPLAIGAEYQRGAKRANSVRIQARHDARRARQLMARTDPAAYGLEMEFSMTATEYAAKALGGPSVFKGRAIPTSSRAWQVKRLRCSAPRTRQPPGCGGPIAPSMANFRFDYSIRTSARSTSKTSSVGLNTGSSASAHVAHCERPARGL
jgi:hypothetical protein